MKAAGCLIALAVVFGANAQINVNRPSPAAAEKVTVCALHRDPDALNHKLIEVDGIVSHGFEHFTLSDPTCTPRLTVWLEYGGSVNSNTVYCCSPAARAPRGGTLVVEGLEVPLRDDALFRRLDARIQRRADVRFRARLIARFFAGGNERTADGERRGGYGHFGCCSLLVIQQVVAIDQGGRPASLRAAR